VGPWDRPEQIWNKLLLLLCNQILSLPSCSSSSSVEHVHHHQSPVGILPTKTFLRLFFKNRVCYNKRSERRREKFWQAEISCSSWSCKWVLIIWGQWKIVDLQSPKWRYSLLLQQNRVYALQGWLFVSKVLHTSGGLYVWNILPLRGHMSRILLNIPGALCMEY
jgi:hypothetical protein